MKEKRLNIAVTLLALFLTCEAMAADLVVSAGASLTNAFTDIGKEFEKTRPGARVLLNFGSSGQLLQQIARGAPVDVFASADQQTMDKAQTQNLIVRNTRENFVRNKLVLVVPANSRIEIGSLAGLDAADVKRIAVANPESVPVGSYSKQALEAAGLWDKLTQSEKYRETQSENENYRETQSGKYRETQNVSLYFSLFYTERETTTT